MRQYTGNNVYELKKAIGAILYHLSEADSDDIQHRFCPQHPETWCAYQLDILHNKNNYKKSKNLLPKAVKEVIKPIFMNLSGTDLLSKCLHGKTQNNNECLNGMVWKKWPKDVFVGRETLEMGVSSAVICFNDGSKDILDVMRECQLDPGYFTELFVVQRDNQRIKIINIKQLQKREERRYL